MFRTTMTIEGFDPELAQAIAGEQRRQEEHVELIASENYTSPRVLEAQGSVLTNKYAEGYPGTGGSEEKGRGAARGTKLNVPLPPGADDAVFATIWPSVIAHVERHAPQFIILQCGADSLEGDPITHLRLSAKTHGRAARELSALAERLGHGRVLALGGGGYNRTNLAQAWNAVVENLLT